MNERDEPSGAWTAGWVALSLVLVSSAAAGVAIAYVAATVIERLTGGRT